MIKIEKTEVIGWEHVIRGMRNPMNSWDKTDSSPCVGGYDCDMCEESPTEYSSFYVGPNDHKLMMQLAKGGPVHGKFRRMITVYLDITAPLYWWKEFDTYKVGTVANSCSTMHKIHAKEFTLEDFSHEHLKDFEGFKDPVFGCNTAAFEGALIATICYLNAARKLYLQTGDKQYWWQMIQLLPTSYNQKRTVMLNYEVLHNIYESRKNHKLDEWHTFCDWIEGLPYSEVIIGDES